MLTDDFAAAGGGALLGPIGNLRHRLKGAIGRCRHRSADIAVTPARQPNAVIGYVPPLELEGKVRPHGATSRKTVKTRRRNTTKAKPSSGASMTSYAQSGCEATICLQFGAKRKSIVYV